MIPQIPSNAPFTPEQIEWLNRFFSEVFSQGGLAAASSAPKRPLLVLFGSQSGNSETLAKKVGREASARGFSPRVAGLESVSAADFKQESPVLIITSTWGEGDMPDNAAGFWDGLNQNGSSPNLAGVQFSVLALGDRNYGDTFCLAGRKLDQRLTELGASRLVERVDCDVEYDAPAAEWMSGVFEALGATESIPAAAADGGGLATAGIAMAPAAEAEDAYSKQHPLVAPLIANHRLNGKESAKDTRHIAFSIEGSGLSYEVGDALGVFPANCPDVVARVMESHRLDPEAVVPLPGGGEAPLRVALERHYEIRSLVGVAGEPSAIPAGFVERLRRLQPRLYSIASSLKAHPGEVHLCVGRVAYEKDGVAHKGVCSTFLADRLAVGDTAGIYVQRAAHFRLPTDASLPVIMVGPGTGIAPFRAFLEERAAIGATGKNWLLFGDQHASSDFLYREEIEAFVRKGILHRLDTAFSRDQERKIYVQNRMMTQAMELFTWLERGAHFYVCGDASKMAKDVDAALHHVLQTIGGKSAAGAAEYVSALKKTGRYQRDVY
ncbi:MAG: sulfite reductase flavoprotein subunit alpha [Verrucomicrobiales bacterium]